MAYEKNSATVAPAWDDNAAAPLVAVPAQQKSSQKRELKDYSPSLQNAARALWGVSREIR